MHTSSIIPLLCDEEGKEGCIGKDGVHRSQLMLPCHAIWLARDNKRWSPAMRSRSEIELTRSEDGVAFEKYRTQAP